MIFDHREQSDGRNLEFHASLGLHEQPVDGQALDAGHGRHRFAAILSVDNEYWIDQVIGGQSVLSNQPARKIVVAKPAHPPAREFSQNMHDFRSYPARSRNAQLIDFKHENQTGGTFDCCGTLMLQTAMSPASPP
jgi:hypothetical protein